MTTHPRPTDHLPETAPSLAQLRAPTKPPMILDATLREGEQTPGVVFDAEAKLEIARLLDAFGVDIIEAGHPAVSPEVRAGVRAVATEGLRANVLAHARAMRDDIDVALSTGADWVGLFFCLRDAALEQRFRRDVDQAERIVVDAVEYARDHGLRVRYTPEDTVRSNFSTVVRIANAAVEAGADRISVADTTGAMTPSRMGAFVRDLHAVVPVPLHAHCHDDLGLAVANGLAAYENGAALIDVTVNGLGERCGITDLAAFTTTVSTLYGHDRWDLEMLPKLAETVAAHAGIPVAHQAPVVGEYAFHHNAGLHVAAVLIDPSHYENLPASRVGRSRTVVVDRFAGVPTVTHRIETLGGHVNPEQARVVLNRVKQIETRQVDDPTLARIYTEVTGRRLDDSIVGGPAGALDRNQTRAVQRTDAKPTSRPLPRAHAAKAPARTHLALPEARSR